MCENKIVILKRWIYILLLHIYKNKLEMDHISKHTKLSYISTRRKFGWIPLWSECREAITQNTKSTKCKKQTKKNQCLTAKKKYSPLFNDKKYHK